jgi:hypothetical protein
MSRSIGTPHEGMECRRGFAENLDAEILFHVQLLSVAGKLTLDSTSKRHGLRQVLLVPLLMLVFPVARILIQTLRSFVFHAGWDVCVLLRTAIA